MFGFGKKQDTEEALVIPAPTEKHYALTEEDQKVIAKMVPNEDGYVKIGDFVHGLLNQQSQYASEYMDGRSASPFLADGLRVDTTSFSYHEYRIHRDDVHEFVARVRAWRNR